jgi:DNA-binding beta-propeller fold protein YncE
MIGKLSFGRRVRPFGLSIATAAVLAFALTSAASGQQTAGPDVRRVAIPPIAGKTLSSDGADIDPEGRRLYVTDRTVGNGGLDVFDLSPPSAVYLGMIPLPVRSSGVVVAANIHRVFVGLADSTIGVIDIDPGSASNNLLVNQISTGGAGRVDLVGYDSAHREVWGANNGEGFISVANAVTGQLIRSYTDLGDNLEMPVYNPSDGMMYFDVSARNVLLQINPVTHALVQTIPIVDQCGPNGFAINPVTNQALLGCSARADRVHTAIWDFKTQKVVQTIEGVGNGDLVSYDPDADRYFFGATKADDGTISMAIFSGGPNVELLGTVPVTGNAPMYDPQRNMVYSADTLPNEGSLFAFPLPW